jgi:phosphoribosylaminoimidazole carboxylase (NCAIR synthetase)
MTKKYIDLSRKIGVLGGGQLGRMLQEAALPYGVELFFLDNDIKAPCSLFKDNFTHGSYKDFNSTIQFGKDKDILTIEIEHINADALEQLAKYDKLVIPAVDTIRMIQNKAFQKKFLLENDLPSSAFIVLDSKSIAPELANDWYPFVQKSQIDGYDGKGVVVIESALDLSQQLNTPSILEKLVDIEKELAITLAIEQSGKIHLFPICEMVFNPKLNLVDYLLAPAGIEEKYIKMAIQAYAFQAKYYYVRSEREITNDGYLDLELLKHPDINAEPHEYVLEVKYLKQADEDQLNNCIVDAKKQLLSYIDKDNFLQSLPKLKAIVIVAVKDKLHWEEINYKQI